MSKEECMVRKKIPRSQRGTGRGKDYIPYIFVEESGSLGTTSNPIDWKNGRVMELLSQAEYWWYLQLRWDDDVIDIREQFPLCREDMFAIAKKEHMDFPWLQAVTLTTDFLVTYKDGKDKALSVKSSIKDLDDDKVLIRQYLEKLYWESKGIPWDIVFKEDLPRQRIKNIGSVTQYYSKKYIHDKHSVIKHLIANKEIIVDMDSQIDFKSLIVQYEDRIKEFGI